MAKEYLSQAFILDRLIKARETQITDLRDKLEHVGGLSTDTRVQTQSSDKTAELTAKLLDSIAEYKKDVIRLLDIKTEIEHVIDSVENPTHRLILFERYINLKRWEDIAADNHYSWDTVHRKHRAALENIKFYQVQRKCY